MYMEKLIERLQPDIDRMIAEGKAEERFRLAKNLYDMKMSESQISQAVEKPVETVRQWIACFA